MSWVAADEVYGRSGKLRAACKKAGLASVFIIPCDFCVTTPAGTVIRAGQAEGRRLRAALLRQRIQRSPVQRLGADRHRGPGEFLLIRKLISRPDQITFYLCYAPENRPATLTYFITIAGRRWPVEETFKTGKDLLGWDQSQVRTFDGICRHTALAALAQLRHIAIRNALHGEITLFPAPGGGRAACRPGDASDGDDADLAFPSATLPSPPSAGRPARAVSAPSGCPSPRPPGSPCSPGSTPPGSSAGPARLRPALVRPPQTAPGRCPLAPLQRPAPRRRRYLCTPGQPKGGHSM